MADMKFKFTIQPYQTEAVESVVGVFAGQPFNDRFTYRRDINVVRDVTNWMLSDNCTWVLQMPECCLTLVSFLKISVGFRHATTLSCPMH